MNKTLEDILKRHSTRFFLEKEIPNEALEAVLNAANSAPSAHNQQSWRFIVVRGEKKAGLANLIMQQASNFSRASAALLRMASRSITSAPVVIAIMNSGELIHHGSELFEVDKTLSTDFFRTMEIQSSSAAVQNLLIAATSMGIDTVWLGIMYIIKNEVMEYLGEEKGEFMAIIPMGYSAKEGHSPKKRSLDFVVKYLD